MILKDQTSPSLELNLPDWSSHQPTPFWRETPDQMDLRSATLLPLAKAHPSYSERRLSKKIDLPFSL